VERIAGILGVPSRWSFGEGHVGIEVWNISMSDSPGSERSACQEGMSSALLAILRSVEHLQPFLND
jgi:hypothetical protein